MKSNRIFRISKPLMVSFIAVLFIGVAVAMDYLLPFSRFNILNPDFNVYSGNYLNMNYSVLRKAFIEVSVLKNGRTMKVIKGKAAQYPGSYALKWNGIDSRGGTVMSGAYDVRLAAWDMDNYRSSASKPIKVRTGSLLFSEKFDRPNGLIADNYGNEDPLGKWDVTSQRLHAFGMHGYTDSPIFRMVTLKSDIKNFTMVSDMMKTKLGINDWDGLQLFFRYKDPDNLYAAGLRNDNAIHLKKKYNGVYYTLAQVPFNSNQLSRWYKMKVVASGSRLQVYVDGLKYIDVTDGSIPQGRVGIRTDDINAYFDNFTVYSM